MPYRDFALEYPPGALPVFVLPALGGAHGDSYRRRFEALMALLGELMLVTVAVALAALGAGRRWLLAALGLAAVAPLLLGPVVLSRFDLWPAALTAIALAALAGDRLRLGHLALGAAVAAKLYAAVLVPIALVYVWRRRGRREALVCGGAARWPWSRSRSFRSSSLRRRASGTASGTRPLGRCRSRASARALLLVSHHVFGTGVTMESSHGSQNLAGTTRRRVRASRSRSCSSRPLVAVWILFARGPATRTRLLYASAAALVAFVALGKVLSPQFLIWLIPVVPLLRGRRGLTRRARAHGRRSSSRSSGSRTATGSWRSTSGRSSRGSSCCETSCCSRCSAIVVRGLVEREPERLAARSAA